MSQKQKINFKNFKAKGLFLVSILLFSFFFGVDFVAAKDLRIGSTSPFIFLKESGGNIGIGTTNPQGFLDLTPSGGIFPGVIAGNIIELSGYRDVSQSATVTISGGTLVSGGPTAKNSIGYWDITSYPTTITINTRGWWSYGGISFTAANVHNYPAGGGNKLPASFLVEQSADCVSYTTVEDVTNYTSAIYYKRGDGQAKCYRITARAAQSGEPTSKMANIQIFDSYSSGKGPFTLSPEGEAVFIGSNVGIGLINPTARLEIYNEGPKNFDLFGLISTTFLNDDASGNTEYAGYFQATGSGLNSYGIFAKSSDGYDSNVMGGLSIGAYGESPNIGVFGKSLGRSNDTEISIGVKGVSDPYWGVGVYGENYANYAVQGYSNDVGTALYGYSQNSYGVHAYSNSNTALYAQSNSGYAAIFQQGKVKIRNLSAGGAVMVDTSGDLYVGSGAAKYVGKTASSTGAVSGGYTGVNAMCSSTVGISGSHLCTTGEILNTINTGNRASIPAGVLLWISNGPPGYIANANDCSGWTNGTASYYGPYWSRTSSDDGSGLVMKCDMAKPFACCK